MSIYLKFNGKEQVNVSKPWSLDIGQIIHVDREGNKKFIHQVLYKDSRFLVEGAPKGSNYEKTQMHHIWPNHDPFRFGLINVVAFDNPNSPAGNLLNLYKDPYYPYQNPLDTSIFYPTDHPTNDEILHYLNRMVLKYYPDHEYDLSLTPAKVKSKLQAKGVNFEYNLNDVPKEEVTYYTIYTPPKAATLVFYLRCCNYRFTKRYQYTYEFQEFDNTDENGNTIKVNSFNGLQGNWLKNAKIEFSNNAIVPDSYNGPAPEFEVEEPSFTARTDATLTISQNENTSLYDDRSAKIILRQYNPRGKDGGYYTGKMVVINIIQMRDRVLPKTQNYQLSWWIDKDCTIPYGGDNQYPRIDAYGEYVLDTYFKISGNARTWTDKTVNIYFKEWDHLFETDDDVVPKVSDYSFIEGSYFNSSTKELIHKTYNGKGRYHTKIKFKSNYPDINSPGEDYGTNLEDLADLDFKIPAERTQGTARFQIEHRVTTEERFVEESVDLYYHYWDSLGGYNYSNWHPYPLKAKLIQDGASISAIVTQEYITAIGGEQNLSVTIVGGGDNIKDIKPTLEGNYIYVYLYLLATNIPTPDYSFDDDPYINPNELSYDKSNTDLYFRVYKAPKPSDPKKYDFNIKANGGGIYKAINQKIIFEHEAFTQTAGSFLSAKDIKCNVSFSDEIPNCSAELVQDGGSFTLKIPLFIPMNDPPQEDIFMMDSPKKYIKDKGVFKEIHDAEEQGNPDNLPGSGYISGEPIHYIGCTVKISGTDTSARSVKLTLYVTECERNPTSHLVSPTLIVKQGGLKSKSGQLVTGLLKDKGFIVKNTIDGSSYDGYLADYASEDNGKYYIPIFFAANEEPWEEATPIMTAPYTIVNNDRDNQPKYSREFDAGIIEIKILATQSGTGGIRRIDYELSHQDITNKLNYSWWQNGVKSEGNEAFLPANNDNLNKLKVELIPNDNVKNTSCEWMLDDSAKIFRLLIRGINDEFHNGNSRVQAKIGKGSSWTECTGNNLTLEGEISGEGGTEIFCAWEEQTFSSSSTEDANEVIIADIYYYNNNAKLLGQNALIPYSGLTTSGGSAKPFTWTKGENIRSLSAASKNTDGAEEVTATIEQNANNQRNCIATARSGSKTITFKLKQPKDSSVTRFGASYSSEGHEWVVTNNIAQSEERTFSITSEKSDGTKYSWTTGTLEGKNDNICTVSVENPNTVNNTLKIVVGELKSNSGISIPEGHEFVVPIIQDITGKTSSINIIIPRWNGYVNFSKITSINTNGHPYVDMGEFGIWATCNVGSNSPSQVVKYCQWADPDVFSPGPGDPPTYKYDGQWKGKWDTYNAWEWTYYKWSYGSNQWPACNQITKYIVNDSEKAKADNKTRIELADDAARKNMGGDWRIPTKEEYEQLIKGCNCVATSQGGVKGCLLTLKTDSSKQLFFPKTGSIYISDVRDERKEYGIYWTSDLRPAGYCNDAYIAMFNSETGAAEVNWPYGDRQYGHCVRGIIKK